jgi:V/A-type H+/Na+-transporting ATPase subunit I
MIAGMKKVHLVLLEKEKGLGLKALRRLGAVHLEPVSGRGQEHEGAARRLAEVERAAALLSSIKASSGGSTARGGAAPAASADAGLATAARTIALAEESRSLAEELAGLTKELEGVSSWGDYEPGDLAALAAAGIPLRLFQCPAQRLAALPEGMSYLRLASPKGAARIAAIGFEGGGIPADLVEARLPARSPSAMRERIRSARARATDIDAELLACAADLPSLEVARARLTQDLAFEAIRSGMQTEGPVTYLSGYVPAADLARLQAEARSRSWGLLADDPAPEDLPPTKVENPPAVRIIDPVFKFLGTVPGYREYDISAWFLGFFSLYFAMIFGDGGYGLIMLAGAVVAAVKARQAGKKLSDAVRLLFVLAVTTVAWGVATATWFSVPAASLPDFLKAIAIRPIMNGNPEADTNIKIFCFILGLGQLSVAHLKNIRRDFPNLKFLGQLGSLLLLAGMFTLVLNLIIDPARFPVPGWALALIGGGFLLVFVFGNWEGSLAKALVTGLKGIVPTFLGTVSVFADIVSYIRLWAVGLAGVAISQTINSMASGAFGEPAGRIVAFAVGAVMGVVLLAVGHALNLVMSVLSVIVHGIRLNILEFSGHLGMEWSGYAYDPFRETVREESSDRREIS